MDGLALIRFCLRKSGQTSFGRKDNVSFFFHAFFFLGNRRRAYVECKYRFLSLASWLSLP